MEKTKLIVVAAVQVEEMAFFGFTQVQSQAYCLQDTASCFVEFPVEFCHERTESWQGVFREPNILLRWVLFAANLVAFLVRIS